MIPKILQPISARLALVIGVMLSGFIVIAATEIGVFDQLNQAFDKREQLNQQDILLHHFEETILASIILANKVVLESDAEAIPGLLALSEDTLALFGQYQSDAEAFNLLQEVYLAQEYEPVVFQLRNDFHSIVATFREQNLVKAQEIRKVILNKRLNILETFLEEAAELRNIDIANQGVRISELKQQATLYSLLIFFAVAMIASILIILVNRSITKPLTDLTHAVDQFDPGNPDTGFALEAGKLSDDEVGRLARSFEVVAQQLQHNELARQKFVDQLEQKNIELERFTYTVSHDLKSPLVTVKGFLGLLERDLESGDTERVKKDMQQITGAADKMGNLLDDLLELSRIGRVVNKPQKFSLSQLTEEVVFLLQGIIDNSGASIKFDDDMPSVIADKNRINEVMQNLLENAVKFAGENNKPKITVSAQQIGEWVECRVKDNGIGIDPRFKEKVFGLFDRLELSIEGTGVGLALVKRIIEVHEGKVWIESQGIGQGTQVCFTLPSPFLKRVNNE